jgi:16S rRNA (guanine966-N2)-methyltransferase
MFMRCDDQRWCDMFAGSGAVGLEALSRGAKEVVFIEKDKEALSIVKNNIQRCKMENQSIVIHEDALTYTHKQPLLEPFDVIFADPPYDLSLKSLIDSIRNTSWYDKDTIFVFERHAQENIEVLNESFNILKQRKVGQSQYVVAKIKV